MSTIIFIIILEVARGCDAMFSMNMILGDGLRQGPRWSRFCFWFVYSSLSNLKSVHMILEHDPRPRVPLRLLFTLLAKQRQYLRYSQLDLIARLRTRRLVR